MDATNEQRNTEAMLTAVVETNERLAPWGLSVVVETNGPDDATAALISAGFDGRPFVLTRRAGNGWQDALERALVWAAVDV